jgi:predicted ATPase
MLLKNVYIRFYKSFNFDYLRKYKAATDKYPWENLDNSWYPFVRIPIEDTVTTVVGANESGKSHLLSAIEKGLTGEGIDRADFCRYSKFFTVAKGERLWPEFGFEWSNLSETEAAVVRNACGLPNGTEVSSFFLFRTAKDQLTVYLRNNQEFSTFKVRTESVSALTQSLPKTFHLDSKLALPSSVSLRSLSKVAAKDAHVFASLSRKRRFAFLDSVGPALKNAPWFQTGETVKGQADAIAATMTAAIAASRPDSTTITDDDAAKLVKDLVFKVAGIDEDVFDDLYQAQRDGKDGHAIGLVERINSQLAARLNFPKWWVQDKEFSLAVRSSDHDLVLTIRDRTGTAYSFDERSGGLKYFLSYYVQYLAHNPSKGPPEILLMDEPDAYLSSQAQQDLLKIFDAFANPTDGSPPIQVIYVTHSPFLIDKNHAERIRVLEKGSNDEGTRVVKDVSRNHYEPLRSAFGAFVGETTFIGNCNLMVEGVADQILLAGAATLLRSTSDAQLGTLDLNTITIVPAGSASHVPYLVYLARGRDVEQPAVIVLLDSDGPGNDARKKLKKGGANGKQLLADRFIMQIADLAGDATVGPTVQGKLLEIEDLIPLSACTAACQQYAKEICGASPAICLQLTNEILKCEIDKTTSAFEGIGKENGTSLISAGRTLFRPARTAQCVLQAEAAGGLGDPWLRTVRLAAIDALPQ